MNNEEKINQILKNQTTILFAMSLFELLAMSLFDKGNIDANTFKSICDRMDETDKLLSPVEEKPINELTEDAFSKTDEVKE